MECTDAHKFLIVLNFRGKVVEGSLLLFPIVTSFQRNFSTRRTIRMNITCLFSWGTAILELSPYRKVGNCSKDLWFHVLTLICIQYVTGKYNATAILGGDYYNHIVMTVTVLTLKPCWPRNYQIKLTIYRTLDFGGSIGVKQEVANEIRPQLI
jgi:hypothetical protein